MIVQELTAVLGLEVDEAVFSKMTAIFNGLSKGLLGVGAAFGAAVVGVGAMVYGTAHAGDEIAKLAEQTGITTQNLQGLAFAATMSDASAESLNVGLRHLARSAYDASTGGQEAKDSFAAVGVSVFDAHGKLKPADELLGNIADKFHDLPNGQTKAALAMKVFGRSGGELIGMLNRGAAGIEALKARAQELGLVMDGETVAAAQEFDDASKELGFAMVGLRNSIGGPLIKAFTKVIEVITMGAVALGKWIRENKVIEKVSKAVTWTFRRLYEVIRALAIALPVAALAWAVLTVAQASAGSSLLFLIAGYIGVGAAAVASAVAAAAAWLAAVAPFVLLAAAIVLIYDELYNFVTGGETMLGRLIKWFETADPTDGPFFKALKAAGALLFDLSDPQKWSAMWTAGKEAITALGHWIEDKLGAALEWVAGKLKSIIPAPLLKLLEFGGNAFLATSGLGALGVGAQALGDNSKLAGFLASPFSGTGGAESPAAAVSSSTTANSSQVHDARVFSPNINVSVPPGSDAQSIAGASAEAVRGVYNAELSASYAAVNQ